MYQTITSAYSASTPLTSEEFSGLKSVQQPPLALMIRIWNRSQINFKDLITAYHKGSAI